MINTSWGQGDFDSQKKPRRYRHRVERVPPKPRDAQLDPLRYYMSVVNALVGPDDPARIYFSRQNLDRIQSMIISRAYNESHGKLDIGPQNEQVILDRMIEEYTKYPYEQAFEYAPDPHPLQTINLRVVDSLMPKVYVGIRQYLNFRRAGGDTVGRSPQVPQSKVEAGEDARALLKDEKNVNTYDPGQYAGPIRGNGPRHLTGVTYRRLDRVPAGGCEPGGNTADREASEKHEWQDVRDRFIRVASKGQI
jgi:hypothetical protein